MLKHLVHTALLLLVIIGLATVPAVAQAAGPPGEAAKPASAMALTPADLAELRTFTDEMEKVNTDRQTAQLFAESAQAKFERALMYGEKVKMSILAIKKLSPEEWEVALVEKVVDNRKVAEWVIRPRPPKPKDE